MNQLLGEHNCKLDEKGRLKMPSAFLRQLCGFGSFDMVINRGFDKNLNLYPKNVWEEISKEVTDLNPFDEEHRDFIRFFHFGATPITTDNAERIMIPKVLMDWGSIKRDLVLIGLGNKIEIWSSENYAQKFNIDSKTFSALAQKVKGEVKHG
ncbi:MAG TPA: division/cell wall cluster transcriptional repressor MraZ [Saprospiraceae bacterium]|nr:division/cell wall cluster transcriptional repressor MraZ [Saprospiraceae bacterium]